MTKVTRMRGTIQKWGNSQAIRLPKTILEITSLKENDTVEIIAEENKIIILTTQQSEEYQPLDKYLERYFNKDIERILTETDQEDAQPREMPWGAPVGDEIW